MGKKKCSLCNRLLDLTMFNKRKLSKDGAQTMCRECNAVRSRKYYKENRKKHLKVVQENRRNRVRAHQAKIVAIKTSNNGCFFCNETESVALEFHHLRDKKKAVSCMLEWRWRAIVEEIQKCIVLCANCHRKVTFGLLKIPVNTVACVVPVDL